VSTYTTEGLVLKTIDYQEADRILTVFTKDRGKISALAKGVRRPESRKGGNVDQLNYVLISLAEGRDLHIVTEVEALSSYLRLKEELTLAVLGYYIAELVDRFLDQGQNNYRIFRAAVMTLSRLDRRSILPRKMLALRCFELQLLEEMGYRPQLRTCVLCGNSVRGDSYLFHAQHGGVLCPNCARRNQGGIDISSRAFSLLKDIQSLSWPDLKRLRGYEKDLEEVTGLLKYYLEWLLERKLGSSKLLDNVVSLSSIPPENAGGH